MKNLDDLLLFDRFLSIIKDKLKNRKKIEYGYMLELLIMHYGISTNDFKSIQYVKNQLFKARNMQLINITRDKKFNDWITLNY